MFTLPTVEFKISISIFNNCRVWTAVVKFNYVNETKHMLDFYDCLQNLGMQWRYEDKSYLSSTSNLKRNESFRWGQRQRSWSISSVELFFVVLWKSFKTFHNHHQAIRKTCQYVYNVFLLFHREVFSQCSKPLLYLHTI